jgi:hypothetical protein
MFSFLFAAAFRPVSLPPASGQMDIEGARLRSRAAELEADLPSLSCSEVIKKFWKELTYFPCVV